MKHWKASQPKDRKTFKSSRLIGVEWEYNDIKRDAPYDSGEERELSPWIKKWKGSIHEDGSCGYEAVTPPLAGDHIARCLKNLGNVLSKHANINSTCSVHCHVNGSDLTWEDLYRLMWVYAQVEDVLFQLAGVRRKTSSYCKPCGKKYYEALNHRFSSPTPTHYQTIPGFTQEKVLSTVYWEALQWARIRRSSKTSTSFSPMTGLNYWKLKASRRGEGRYVALNLFPWLYAKKVSTFSHKSSPATLEFRLHQHTKDTKRVINWSKLLVRLVDWCKQATDQQARELPSNGLKALLQIAPGSSRWIKKQLGKKKT